ncbi:chromate resistance protein ChrB domain-containing protein [Paraburkholderia phymatum]|uniref:chromate resistance protein ChrB domain-containing protein n=1 Tax=Paraburkholderia phymatum TaxID=148447 RepID=UPI00316F8A00
MRWVTRERPKVDRIACPWLVQRFIDPDAEFLYVHRDDVMRIASELEGTPYDVPDVELGHHGEQCSFDAFLQRFQLTDPALHRLANIVRGADTGRVDLAPEAASHYAMSSGLSRTFTNGHEQLRYGMLRYDALCVWCKHHAHA